MEITLNSIELNFKQVEIFNYRIIDKIQRRAKLCINAKVGIEICDDTKFGFGQEHHSNLAMV